jgi:hypothetical protein
MAKKLLPALSEIVRDGLDRNSDTREEWLEAEAELKAAKAVINAVNVHGQDDATCPLCNNTRLAAALDKLDRLGKKVGNG